MSFVGQPRVVQSGPNWCQSAQKWPELAKKQPEVGRKEAISAQKCLTLTKFVKMAKNGKQSKVANSAKGSQKWAEMTKGSQSGQKWPF